MTTSPANDPVPAWTAAIGAAAQFPGLPLVGYEAGHALDAATAAGFTAFGPLRVWLKSGLVSG